MFSLAEKRAFITGGCSGIGLAVARCFVEYGARVAIADIADGAQIAEDVGTVAVHCDVADEDSVEQALEEAVRALAGPLDVVVLNAGIGDVGPYLGESDQDLVDRVTRINQLGVLYGLKHAPARMADGGTIINTASMAGFIGLPGQGVYSASKRAVMSLTETAALELGSRGIRVNCVCPGYTETAMGSGDEGRQLCETFTALGRVASVDDLVGAYWFLASDASTYITGHALMVDGGWHCGLTPQLLELVTGSSRAPS